MENQEVKVLDQKPFLSGSYGVSDYSYKWLQQNKVLKCENEFNVQDISKIAEETKNHEFDILRTVFYQKHYDERLEYRFPKMVHVYNPYRDNLITLTQRPHHDESDTFYNSSPIQLVVNKETNFSLIACEAPRKNTMENFWRVVLQEKVNLILTLCEISDEYYSECQVYWPEGQNEEYIKTQLNEITVEKISEKELWSENFIERMFKVQNSTDPEAKEHIVRQIHFKDWGDWSIPPKKILLYFTKMLLETVNSILSDQRLLVHCRAGVGRTGTFISLLYILILLIHQKNNETAKLSIFSIVRRLREQRPWLVESLQQYKALYQLTELFIKTKVL